ncbi:MAG TPA: ABC transporter ATP-binding protein [Acidimicrobiales bacterium]|jgi:ABC-type multidrug transport system ATPase subunit|nr:ABC transporter ATP-binding protein [Acidimicrobiales bacterium]
MSQAEPPVHVLEAEGLTKAYGDLIALEPLDLTVPEGQRLVLVGHNGSGKTTLLRMAAGLLEPSGGEVRIVGAPAGSLDARAAASYLPDTPVLYDDLSVLEHIEYVCRLHDADDWEERAVGLLAELGLTDRADDLPSRFSRGLRQKTAILLGLIRPFSVLLVDEPFVGLDPPGRAAFVDLVADASASGATVIVATHQLDYLRQADRCIALRDGAVVYDGPPGGVDVEALVG